MYVKLFSSLYQGTLRGQTHPIVVFTNLLAHCDREGFVDVHWRVIADETGLTQEQVRAAIAYLEEPDPDSRTPDEDGRRLVKMDDHRDWGWRVVNYAKYRAIRSEEDRRDQNREAQARKRQRSQPASATVSRAKPRSAHADAEVSGDVAVEARLPSEAITAIPEFETLKSLYPNRAGDQRWPHAVKACKARLTEGHTWDEIIAGVGRYREFVEATGKIGTEYVQQAATFLGPGKSFTQKWAKPASAQSTKLESVKQATFSSYANVMAKLEAKANEQT